MLAALIGFLILAPFLPTSLLGRAAVQLLVTMLIIASAATEQGRPMVLGVTVLTALWVASSWAAVLLDPPAWVGIAGHAVVVILLLLGVRAALVPVFAARRVDAATIAGAVCGYLMLAFTWAALYQLIATFDPDAFSGAAIGSSWINAVYLSLVTLTTVGYGDIVAHHPVARIWCGLEAVVGNLYMAVLIARLVSQWRTDGRPL